MSPVAWMRSRWAALRGSRWGAECPDGAPVPVAARCAAVDCDAVPLTALAEGEGGVITCLADPDSVATRKLVALGILPGRAVELTQRFPAFVFRIGHAEFATDAELAERVRVRRRWGTNQPEAWTVPHAVIK